MLNQENEHNPSTKRKQNFARTETVTFEIWVVSEVWIFCYKLDQETSTYDNPVVLGGKIRYEPFSSRMSEKERTKRQRSLSCPIERRNETRGPEAKGERLLCVSSAFPTRVNDISFFLFLIIFQNYILIIISISTKQISFFDSFYKSSNFESEIDITSSKLFFTIFGQLH